VNGQMNLTGHRIEYLSLFRRTKDPATASS
jgi:hypothetical protein